MLITKDNINEYKSVGRLGNQLFIIAAGSSLAKKYNCEFILKDWKYSALFPNVKIGNVPATTYTYTEPTFTYVNPIFYTHNGIISLNGYFQSWKYFSSFDEIRNLFFMNVQSPINVSNKIGIHIRRSDYLQYSHVHNNLCSTEYYKKAMQKFSGEQFIVFSDDINFCKKYLSNMNEDIEYSEYPESIDLKLITECKHIIIANSSFSWWGAFLNKNNPTVIMPNEWFTGGCIDSSDLKVPEWNLM